MMQVREIMTEEVKVESLPVDAVLEEAARQMKSLDVGMLPIYQDKRLVGMLTDRDIIIRALAEGLDPKNTRVSAVMTPEVIYCFLDQDVSEAAKLMEDKQIRRLIVLDRDKKMAGIISLGDIASTKNKNLTGEALEKISEPAKEGNT